MKRPRRFLTPLLWSALLALLPAAASACSVCMGANSKTGPAINGAIFLMLGFVASILTVVGAFAYNLAKRARSPLPPHAELSQMMTGQEDTK
ncbi:MAG: hypothetical protein P4L99_29525 [Chthoniobacter sp.]|nr:hypothetical protein [Chthoniobacter sp.]